MVCVPQIPSKLKEGLKVVKEGIEQRLRDDQKLVSHLEVLQQLHFNQRLAPRVPVQKNTLKYSERLSLSGKSVSKVLQSSSQSNIESGKR
jgi:hypothetical protein